MQIIKTRIHVNPESKGEFIGYLQDLSSRIKQNFDGCDQFELLATLDGDASFVLYEEWQSEEAFKALRQSDIFKEIGLKARPMLSGQMEMVRYTAEAVTA